MTEQKLKPCPFCGGKVKVTNLDGNIHYGRSNWCVVCWDCGLVFTCGLTYGGLHRTKQRRADNWNKRVESDTK